MEEIWSKYQKEHKNPKPSSHFSRQNGTHTPRGPIHAHKRALRQQLAPFLHPRAKRRASRLPAAPMGRVHTTSSARKCACSTKPDTWAPRRSPPPIRVEFSAPGGPGCSLARSKLQVFAQFARAMCPSLPKSPIVMRHVASPKSNSLSVEIKAQLRICPFNCQKSPKII